LELVIVTLACSRGLIECFHISVTAANFITTVIAFILFILNPLLLFLVGALGAIFGWHWNPFAAIAFFILGPIVVNLIILGSGPD
jgi:hypothetical protein